MQIRIRPLCETDIPAVEHICLATAAPARRKNTREQENTLLLYNRCYTRTERDFCFVAADETDCARGYILCAPDLARYRAAFAERELKEIRKLGLFRALNARGSFKLQAPFAKEYPAHLHIDLLPEIQGRGIGSQLMQALKEKLTESGVPGVFLCVSSNNTRAVAFYKKHGFAVLRTLPGGLCMGCKL